MAIQIGKYRRPGIFIEEFDNSVIATPTVAGIFSLVVGFSKKGPVNSPVLLQTVSDLERIFGPLDRVLERKGSFFHRTVSKMLESNPVYAMNLLSTSDILDLLEYKSVSTATDKTNDVIREGAYRRFFDTTGFWKRSTDSFITLVSDDAGATNRLLSFTNMSDRYISIFVFKSRLTGFNRTLLEWYGSTEKVPLYVDPRDYASDYLVDVLVVAGDWSNYAQLSVDNKWSAYFTSEGLDKTQVDNFANDRNVTTLAYYQGLSLIPYFRDSNGRNIFIETIINSETERTGLFCAFDMDKLEKDFNTGLVDLIGNNLLVADNLVNNGQTNLEFLSYDVKIVENLTYDSTPLDIAGGTDGQQVFAFGPTVSVGINTTWGAFGSPNKRTAFFAEEFINGVKYATSSQNFGTSSLVFGYLLSTPTLGSYTSSNSYFVSNANKLEVNSGTAGTFTFSVSSSDYTVSTVTASYTSVVHLNSAGEITLTNGTTDGVAPTIPTNDLVLSYLDFTVTNGFIATASIVKTDVGVNNTGFNELVHTTDYEITEVTPGTIKVEFYGTAQTDVTNDYDVHRKIRIFNKLVSILDTPNLNRVTILRDASTQEKLSLSGATIQNIVTSTTSNKSFELSLGINTTPQFLLDGNLVVYKIDNEFTLGTKGTNTRSTVGTASYGVVGEYSDFYQDFVNGQINTGDFLYSNFVQPYLPNTAPRVVFQNEGTYSYVYLSTLGGWSVNGSEKLLFPDSTLNTGVITLDGNTNYRTSLNDPDTGTTYASGFAYRVTTDLVDEELTSTNYVLDSETKVYLKMYLDGSENLQVEFMDSALSSSEPITLLNDANLYVYSNKSNYKQSIEIEEPSGYTPVVNKILCNASRYTEVKVGDFLEAYVDPSIVLETGEVPRNLTRIIGKRLYSADTSLVEITCDAAIEKKSFGTDKQTMRYTSIDDYVSIYKSIPLKGFRVREASMPDGTETRQNAILNLIAKGTPLFKALTNKEAIDFRYVVDSFGLGLIDRSKQQLVDLCGSRLDCFGFLNMPSIKSFKNSSSPSFVDPEGVLQTSYIATGGNLESSPAFLYSFGDGRGVSCVGYFTPYVTVNDNGRPFDVPPSAYVATTYMRKINSNITSIVPWTVAAGVTNGRVTGIAGIEMNFTLEDIENLNTAQMNPIVYKRNRGYVIETENTAQTLYKSALSYIHVREVLIELERELSAMLLEFQWKFNTADIRAEIKLRADVICEKYVNKNGLYNYFNKCDEENNTAEIIDNQIGVLDTYVEPIKSMGVIVNNITILRTGAIESGGFISQ